MWPELVKHERFLNFGSPADDCFGSLDCLDRPAATDSSRKSAMVAADCSDKHCSGNLAGITETGTHGLVSSAVDADAKSAANDGKHAPTIGICAYQAFEEIGCNQC